MNEKRKTILIPIFDGMVARNILHTDVIRVLKKKGLKVVIIPPKGKSEYYRSEFSDGKQVFIEDGPFWRSDLLSFVSEKIFLHSIPTNFMRIRQKDWYWNKGKHMTYVGVSILRLCGHLKIWHSFLRLLDSLLPVPAYTRSIIDYWNPDIVFAPTMITRDEVALMRLGKKHGARVVGMFKSWDNPTSKAFPRFFPDIIIAHTQINKDETRALYAFPQERIVVTGVPQFDDYLAPGFISSREEFFKKIGGDLSKKLITFAPAGDWMNLHDKEILERILNWIDEGKLGEIQVLLRLHPAYESKTEELSGHPHLIVERPGKHFEQVDKAATLKSVEFGIDEMKHLGSTMKWSAVTINTASTMTIEAAIFDTPIVLLGFDGSQKCSYWRSVRRYYDREHYLPIMKSGGAALVQDFDELLNILKEYLDNPKLNHAGRERIRVEQCYKLDGKAGERVAEAIISGK